MAALFSRSLDDKGRVIRNVKLRDEPSPPRWKPAHLIVGLLKRVVERDAGGKTKHRQIICIGNNAKSLVRKHIRLCWWIALHNPVKNGDIVDHLAAPEIHRASPRHGTLSQVPKIMHRNVWRGDITHFPT